MNDKGLITVVSGFSVPETIDRLETIVASKGMQIFARIDHAGLATRAGLTLRPTELLIFGNPTAGTPLMQDRQIAGIDLPVKVLAWEDADAKVWLTYNDPAWLARRHNLGPDSSAAVTALAAAMTAVTTATARP